MIMFKYFKYIGLNIGWSETGAKRENYVPEESMELAERYLSYLKEMDLYQIDRRNTIETKNSQLIGQASIVTSIFSLFVPLLLDNFYSLPVLSKILITVIFLIVLGHYLLTIFHATKTLEINKYCYPNRSTSTVTKKERAQKEIDFINDEINDLIHIVDKAAEIDNKKGENLIYATRCFQVANFGFGFLTIVITIIAFTNVKNPSEAITKESSEFNLKYIDTLKSKTVDPPASILFNQVQDSINLELFDEIRDND